MQKIKNKILVSGSVVIDTLFGINGDINKSISLKDGKLGVQNLMFTGKDKKEFFGGNAGNICYGLSLLGQKPILFSIVGKDFKDRYEQHLKNRCTPTLFTDKEGYCATFYGMTDENGQQIGIFQPNAYYKYINKISLSKVISKQNLSQIEYAIFSPGTGPSILKNIKELRKVNKKVFIILDPGQTLLATFNKKILLDCLKLSNMIIVNDHELSQIRKHFEINLENIFESGTKYVIETKAEMGSVLHESNKKTEIKALKVKKLLDPTGAGDAYRAGLISTLCQGRSLIEGMKIGSKMGAKCVQNFGGQTYRI